MIKVKRGRGRPPRRRRTVGTQTKKYKKRVIALQPHTFVERATSDNLDVAPEIQAVGLFKKFKLSDIPQSSDYTAIFEDYKLTKIIVKLRYKSIGQQARVIQLDSPDKIVPVNEVNPVLYYKIDHNDADTDTIDQLKRSVHTKEHQFTNDKPNFTIVIKPSVLTETTHIKGSLGIAYRPSWNQWLPVSEVDIEHFGLKMYAVGNSGGGTSYCGSLEVQYQYYFTMKNDK